MGDGTVALILDVLGLAQRASVVSRGARARAVERQRRRPRTTRRRAPDGAAVRASATAAAWRSRCRWWPGSRSSRARASSGSGDREVVQYRGEILPLVAPVDSVLRPAPATRDARDRASGCRSSSTPSDGRSVGLVVEQHPRHRRGDARRREPAPARPGVLGTAVIQERVTELLDVRRRSSGRPIRDASASRADALTRGGAEPMADDAAVLHVLPRRPVLRRRRAARCRRSSATRR